MFFFGQMRFAKDLGSTTLSKFMISMPDQNEWMTEFDDKTTIEEVSWFLHRRPDRYMFSSVWACLFSEAVRHYSHTQLDQLLRSVQDGSFSEVARRLMRDSGVSHHPTKVFQRLDLEQGDR